MSTTFPASDAQKNFIATLTAERVFDTIDIAALTKKDASAVIEALLNAPKKNSAPALEVGFYILENTVFRVVQSKQSTKRYAKRLDITNGKGAWIYSPGAMVALVNAQPLTLEIARAMGAHYGVCMICGATLTDETSVSQGIGPICIKKL